MWLTAYWIISSLAVKIQDGEMEGFWCKHLKWLSANLVEKYSCFFNSFPKVPKHLTYDGLSHSGHLLSLPSSTFQGGYLFIFFFRVQNWTCQQWAATQLCKECHGWRLCSCRGRGWASLVQQHHTQEPLCPRDPPWCFQMPSLLEECAKPPHHVAQCLVLIPMMLALW